MNPGMVYGPGAPSLERYRDETVPQWHTRLIGEVALRGVKRAYADMVAGKCRKPGCRTCRRDAEGAAAELAEAEARLERVMLNLRRKRTVPRGTSA